MGELGGARDQIRPWSRGVGDMYYVKNVGSVLGR